MRISFTQIPDKLPYPPNVRAQLSTLHSEIITSCTSSYTGSFSFRRKVVDLINSVSYYILTSSYDSLKDWSSSDMFSGIALVDPSICRAEIGQLFLTERDIDWDIAPAVESDTTPVVVPKPLISEPVKLTNLQKPTPKSDLYIQPPQIAQFDVKSVWMSRQLGDCTYTIYTSLPIVPTKQCEVSVTTDMTLMTDVDLVKIYPNTLIRTRAEALYSYVPGITYNEDLGLILPVEGFTEAQIIDNIIKYPHLYKLTKLVDDKICSFYSTIEIDGTLHKVSDIWNTLPESAVIPYVADFVKEYVVRRYLLERDVKGIDHKYKMFGYLDPFLTLFMPIDGYAKFSYTDAIGIAKKCVQARIRYKQSRNPVIRRIKDV